ncbi:FAD-dependent oxidoreductase [Halobaculum rarum]|uniref:FAD-dependent oxidoreductase n=1 Tax=Halobaculum rarum TaxID=3075122 RepID=UPI0032AF5350
MSDERDERDDTTDTDDAPLPGTPTSLWLATSESTDYGPLAERVAADVAVVGGGIVGLTTATLLAEAGRDVALLERDRIVAGVTGKSTAKVTAQHGLVYADLLGRFGRPTAARYAAANAAAVERVAERAERLGVDAGLRRLPAYTYTRDPERKAEFRAEVRVAESLGLPASYVEGVPGVDGAVAGVRFDDQAMFHPRRYLLALAARFLEAGGHLYEDTRAVDLEDGRRPRVTTDHGRVVADHVVVATHFPVFDRAGYFSRLYPKRSYVVAVRASDPPTEGMLYRDGTPYFSARSAEVDGETLTLVGGQNHKTGQGGDTKRRYRDLEATARRHFDVEEVVYRWSTQDYVSVDGLPVVGDLGPTTRNVSTAAGFAGWGMSNGVAAGMMLSDRVLGEENPWIDAFDPGRFARAAGARDFLSENLDVAGHFLGDWLSKPRKRELRDLAPGQGTVVREGTLPVAVHRDEAGRLHAHSAVCPHLKCVVDWNPAEASWDCPCHGSRFDADGAVIDGPAVSDLPKHSSDGE